MPETNSLCSYCRSVFRKHSIIVLSDEIYSRLNYAHSHQTLSKVNLHTHTHTHTHKQMKSFVGSSFALSQCANFPKFFKSQQLSFCKNRIRFIFESMLLFQYYPEGTILSSGMSKWASAGGWRVGISHSLYKSSII